MPGVSPVIVLLVAGGVPVTVVAVCAAEPMYGVMSYDVGGPPVAGAVHDTLAEAWPAVAVTPVTWPGAPAGWKSTSTP